MRQAPPPSRYRIYERNRRLVVVDNWAEGGADRAISVPVMAPRAARQGQPGKLNRIAFDGRTSFTTHPLFDAKGPRTLVLDPGSASVIGGMKVALGFTAALAVFLVVVAPYLLLPLVVLLQRKPRERMRGAITAWLDRAGNQPS